MMVHSSISVTKVILSLCSTSKMDEDEVDKDADESADISELHEMTCVLSRRQTAKTPAVTTLEAHQQPKGTFSVL